MTATLPSSISPISAILHSSVHWVLPPPTGKQILAPDPLTLIGRAEGARDIDLGDIHLQTANFNGFLDNLIMGNIGHDMLVGTDTGRQNLRNIGIGQGRETPVDAAGSRTGPFGSDIAKGIDKGKDSVLVIEQHSFVVAGLNPAEGHGGAVGKTKGKNGRGNIRTEGNDTGIPADLHSGFDELLG